VRRRLQGPLEHATRLLPHPIPVGAIKFITKNSAKNSAHRRGRAVPPLLPPHVLDASKPPLAEQEGVGPQLLDAYAIGTADSTNFGLPPAVSRGFMRTVLEE
jgi:hypothetical protein